MSEKIVNEISDASSPQVVEQFIGQERVKSQVRVALEACWNDSSRFPDTLSLGSPGLGKSCISSLIAKEMGTSCKEALGNNFKNISDLQSYLLHGNPGDILFIDELHELRKDLVVVLYRSIENKKLFVKSHNRKTPYCIELSDFTLVAATTDAHRIPKALADRFKLILNFQFYTHQEIEQILRNRTAKIGWACQETLFGQIASMSRGIPRIGLRILENTRRVSRADNSDTIMPRHLKRNCQLEGLDSLGLGAEERQYLRILADHDGPLRLNTIAMSMGTLSHNISKTIEPFLFRAGLIFKDDKGRYISSNGLEHIRNNPIVN